MGTSLNHDVRICGQFVLRSTIHKFPRCKKHNYVAKHRERGQLGIHIGIMTIDGNNYYPSGLAIEPYTPASEADIQLEDMIIAVDGQSMRNKTWVEAIMMLDGSPGDIKVLTIKRLDKEIKLSAKLRKG